MSKDFDQLQVNVSSVMEFLPRWIKIRLLRFFARNITEFVNKSVHTSVMKCWYFHLTWETNCHWKVHQYFRQNHFQMWQQIGILKTFGNKTLRTFLPSIFVHHESITSIFGHCWRRYKANTLSQRPSFVNQCCVATSEERADM